MANITNEQLEELGRIVDKASNYDAATKLPVSLHIHAQGMKAGLQELHSDLRSLYVAIAGEDPWASGIDR